jgi:galactose mutarotase-like enzyme
VNSRSYMTTWLGQPALTLETSALRLVTVPEMGAKIVSLFDKQNGREWLLPPTNRDFRPVAYGASFVDQDMSGWDEIFPTTVACLYPAEGRYKHAPLPDHGEVWAIPWQVDGMMLDSIRLSTVGHALPYRLTRTAQVIEDQRVRLAYEVVNTSSEPLTGLWSAHPQFVVDAETRVRLPEGVTHVVNVHATDDWPEPDRLYPWTEAQSEDGQRRSLDVIGTAELRRCRKFFAHPDQPINWAALQQGDDGAWVRLSWDSDCIPYFGLWVDEGTYNPAPTAALEPTTGYYDRLDRAWKNERAMRLPPNTPVHWSLDVELGHGTLGNPSHL